MLRAWIIARKELRLLFRDRRALVILIALPVMFITIIGFSVGELLGSRSQSASVRLGVVNKSQSELSREIVTSLEKREGLRVFVISTPSNLNRELERDKLDAGIIIWAEFDERVETLRLGDVMETRSGPLSQGLSALEIQVLTANDNLGIGDLVRNLLFGEALRTIGPFVVERNGGIPARILKSARERHKTMKQPAKSSEVIVSPRQLSYQMLVPSYTVLFVFFVITFMARSFLSERETGTFQRLLVSPVQPLELLVGKMLPFFLLSTIQTLILFLAGVGIFGMRWGSSPSLLLPTIVLTAAVATTLGLVTALLVRSDSQISAYVVFLLLVMGGLSGCLVPRIFLPDSMQTLSLCTPHAWSLIAFEETLKTGPPSMAKLTQCWLALFAFSGALFGWGLFLFRRRVIYA